MLRKIRNVMAVIFGMVVLLMVSAIVLAFVFQDKIKRQIVAEVNEQISVPVKVGGDISLSLLKHFPYASLTFEKVSIDDKLRGGNKKLLNVEEFSFLCNIFSLFGDHIEFSKVLVRGGELNLYKDATGKVNFDILKPSPPGKPGSPGKLSVQLSSAEIKNVKFTYADLGQALNIDAVLKQTEFKGDFTDGLSEMELKGLLHANDFTAGSEGYAANRELKVDVILNIDKNTDKYDFKKGDIGVDGCDFRVTGFFALLKVGTQLDFQLRNSGENIQRLFSLLPAKYKRTFANAEGKGEYMVTAGIKGVVSRSSSPTFNLNIELKNSELKLGKYDKLLKKVNASATYESNGKGADKLVISNFNCVLDGQPFNFNLIIVNLSNPAFDFYADGAIKLVEFSTFVPEDVMQDLDGSVEFHKFHLKGRKADFMNPANSTLNGSGEFTLRGVQFKTNEVSYTNINGSLTYNNHIINAQNFTLNFLESDYNFTGTIDNLLAYVYSLSVDRGADNVVMDISGKVNCRTLNLNGIFDTYNKKSQSPVEQGGKKITIRDVLNMKGNLDISIGKFIARKMEFDNLQANLQIAPGMIMINSLTTATMSGNIRGRGLLTFTPQNSLQAKCEASAVQLDIPKIFYECENFGQSTLTSKNLSGTISTSVSFYAEWFNYSTLNRKSMSAVADFNITNGHLVDFEPIRAASAFIKLNELNDIRFADISNHIEIENGQIVIPEFEIQNSALNLMLSGHHNFDNTADYHFKINLHKLMAKKFGGRQRDLEDYIETDPYEGLNIYLSMTGDMSNPKIKYDKATARKKMVNDLKQGTTELKGLFKGNAKKTNENEAKREDKYFKVPQEPKFLDFDTTGN